MLTIAIFIGSPDAEMTHYFAGNMNNLQLQLHPVHEFEREKDRTKGL